MDITQSFTKIIKEIISQGTDRSTRESPALYLSLETKIEEATRLYAFTRREREVVGLVCLGRANDEIASHLAISLNTVKHHLYNIFNKAGVDSRAHLIYLVLRVENAPRWNRYPASGTRLERERERGDGSNNDSA